MVENVLDERQRNAASRVLREEDGRRDHVAVSLSGAHAYGFPSPDSDLDLKAVHVLPTVALLGLDDPRLEVSRLEWLDGIEVDYGSNEIQPVLAGVLKGNGNYLERILGAFTLRTTPEHQSLRPLVKRSLSRRVSRHYRGFATGQLRELEKSPSVKKAPLRPPDGAHGHAPFANR